MNKKTKTLVASTEMRSLTPLEMASYAMQRGDTLEAIQSFLDLNDRLEAKDANKAYITAMADFKSESIEILKDKAVYHNDTYKYNHATLGKIIEIVVPLLAKYGLSHHWNPLQEEGKITIQCIMTHKDGHSDKVEMFGPPDPSGGKNAIQAITSTASYLERVTFMAICGLASKDQDNDGNGAEPEPKSGFEEKIDYGKLNAAVNFFKEVIDKDDIENHLMIKAAMEKLNNNEKMALGEKMKDKPKDSKKMYKSILKEYLEYAPE